MRESALGRPPWSYARVVKRCPALSPRAKLCWLEHYALWFSAAGCTTSASVLGRRIATSQAAVERLRALFVLVGLMDRQDRGIGRTAGWRVTLPEPCRPTSPRITDDQCAALAQELAAHIVARLNAAQSALTPRGRFPTLPPLAPTLLKPPSAALDVRALRPQSSEGAPPSELRGRFMPDEPVTAGELEKLDRLEMLDQVNGRSPGKSDETGRVADEENGPPAWPTDQPWPDHDPDADALQDDDDAAPV